MLTLDGIVKSYAGFDLGPIDLAVENEVLAVLGPSGCGKTTLLSAIAGIIAPDSGRVRLGGRDLTGVAPENRGTALVFQDGALFPHMTARENVAYAAESEARVAELVSIFDIEDVMDQSASALSGGERQRVALARALAADPDALLLDEPLSGLDAPIRRRLADDLRVRLAAAEVPVVYVTHDRREASVVADRLAVLRAGRIQQIGSPRAVFERPATPFVARFTGAVNVFRARIVASKNNKPRGQRTQDGTPLAWHGRTLDAPTAEFDPGAAVWFCVRPERVVLDVANTTTGNTDSTPKNTFLGRVSRQSYEGDGIRIVIELGEDDEAANRIEVSLSPTDATGSGLDTHDPVWVCFPPDAIHVMSGDTPGSDERNHEV